jgi:gentisate 1,2-dioxygenase
MDRKYRSMAEMGVQAPSAPASAAQSRGRYFNSANAFNIKLPAVPGTLFSEPAEQAMRPDAASGFYPCDQSAALGCAVPATTPFMLASYLRLAAGVTVSETPVCSGTIWYVIAGEGESDCVAADECIAWRAGDIFFLPGSVQLAHRASSDAVLWRVSDEPLLGFGGFVATPRADIAPVHYPATEIAHQMAVIDATDSDTATSGRALVFSTESLEAGRNILPTLTLSFNTLPPAQVQPAHRHNSAAITLIVQGEGCHSVVDDVINPWSQWGTLVTPPAAVHSHHNGGTRRADFLIVQDGGLYYQARTMGFVSR